MWVMWMSSEFSGEARMEWHQTLCCDEHDIATVPCLWLVSSCQRSAVAPAPELGWPWILIRGKLAGWLDLTALLLLVILLQCPSVISHNAVFATPGWLSVCNVPVEPELSLSQGQHPSPDQRHWDCESDSGHDILGMVWWWQSDYSIVCKKPKEYF